MIRRTQSLAIRRIESKLDEEGYSVIYTDEPGSSRSGPGVTSDINLTFEHLYDRTPDLVAITPDNQLLIAEVDSGFKSHLPDKYSEYEDQSEALISRLSDIIGEKITGVSFGFGTTRKRLPEIQTDRSPFHKFYLPEIDIVVHTTN